MITYACSKPIQKLQYSPTCQTMFIDIVQGSTTMAASGQVTIKATQLLMQLSICCQYVSALIYCTRVAGLTCFSCGPSFRSAAFTSVPPTYGPSLFCSSASMDFSSLRSASLFSSLVYALLGLDVLHEGREQV